VTARTGTSDGRDSGDATLGVVDVGALTVRCRARLAELDLPRPFDVAEFADRIGRDRGRPLVRIAHALPVDGPRGLCLSTRDADYIVYEQATTPVHQEHIVLHEISHLLCGHAGGQSLGTEHARRLFPSLDPAVVGRVLGRTSYSTEEEQEAELLASMIQQATRGDRAPARAAVAEDLRRLESGL
jgi:hypothetical protein